MSKEVSAKEMKAFLEEKDEFVPTETEEQEEGQNWTVKKEPRILTPEQAKAEQNAERKQTNPNEGAAWEHQTIEIAQKKHVSDWNEDVYEAIIEKTRETREPDTFNTNPDGSPTIKPFIYVMFVTKDGRRIHRRFGKSYHPRSKLHELVEIIYGEAPEALTTDDLVGKRVRITVKNKTNANGDEWPQIVEFLPSVKQFKAGHA